MNKILSIFKAENIKNWLKNVFFNFTTSALLSLIATFFLVLIVLDDYTDKTLVKLFITTVITFFTSVWFYITWNSFWLGKYKNQLFQIFPILIWFIFYCFFSSNINIFYSWIVFIISLIWIISFLFFAPFLKEIFSKKLEKEDKNNYFSYFYWIYVTFISTIFIWLFSFLLISIWFLCINFLFDVHISEKVYMIIFAIISCFLCPFIWLNSIFKILSEKRYNEKNFSDFIIKYISIPVIFIYFIILYIYFIKVLLNFSNWPKWEISWMIIIFSLFWYIVYIFSYVFEEKIWIVKIFRKYFHFVVFPQIFMLFYSIYLRVNQYWLTINRYLVIIFGILLLILTLYFIFSRKKFIAIIPFSLFIVSLLSIIWPWSIYYLPEQIQTNLLIEKLNKENLINKDWTIKRIENLENFSSKNIKEINSKIDYLCDYHSCDKLAKTLKINWKKNISGYDVKNIIWSDDFTYYAKAENELYLYLDLNKKSEINISWYNYLKDFETFTLDEQEPSIFVSKDWKDISKLNLKENLKNLINEYTSWKTEKELEQFLSFEVENNEVKAKILIENISLDLTSEKWLRWTNHYLKWKIIFNLK